MRLEEMTWYEVQSYLKISRGIILPTGSVEQHGPIGLIGTDAICAREISWTAANLCKAIVAPTISYAPANFNMSFPGTVSLSPTVYEGIIHDVLKSLSHHGFEKIYVLNGHGANLEILENVVKSRQFDVQIRSWWDFDAVNVLRNQFYGDWEGMHATPSEISITQHTHRIVNMDGLDPPDKLSAQYIAAHSGDKHGPPDEHRAKFPDGRVGSHSGLAQPENGRRLLEAAAMAVANDYLSFVDKSSAFI